MKIIEIGNWDIKLMCPECHTIFEINTRELSYNNETSCYCYKCPLCEHEVVLNKNGEIGALLKKAKEMKEKL